MAPQTTRKIETIDTAQKRGKKTRIKWLRVVCGVFSTYSFDLRGSSWYLVPLPPYCAPLTTVELCLCHDILAPPQSIARCNFILFLVARCCWKKKKQQQPDDLLRAPAEYFTHFFLPHGLCYLKSGCQNFFFLPYIAPNNLSKNGKTDAHFKKINNNNV